MFAYESEFGFVAAGTVQEAWDGKSYEGGSDLYPKLNENEKIYKIRVSWDTSIQRLLKEVSAAGVKSIAGTLSKISDQKLISFLSSLLEKSYKASTQDAEEEDEVARIYSNVTLSETEKVALAKSRLGQGLFRSRLQLIEPKCRLTGVTNPELLKASHIKPWRVCTGYERLDGNNGLFLSPHVDHLFDKHLITFTETGDLLVASSLTKDMLAAWGLPYQAKVGTFSEEQAQYLEHHRKEFFEKNTAFTGV